MIKRILFEIMKNFAPAFIVVCVLFCLSYSCTFPLHKTRVNDLTGLLNHSRKCAAAGRAKKTTTGEPVIGSQDFEFDSDTTDAKATKRKLSGNDLRQYEQLVLMKKYPYLDPKEFELKFGPFVKSAKYRAAEIAEASECKLTDDEPRVEIFSRGISGFAIPKSPKIDVKPTQDSQEEESVGKNNEKSRASRVWNNLKDFSRNDLY